MKPDRDGKPGRRSLRALARLAVGSKPPRVQGFVDALVHGDTIVGWARDPRDPARRLEIQLLHDGKVVGFGLADLARQDLLAQNMGDGRHGFRLRLSPALLDGSARRITVCAVTEKGKMPLQRGELTLAAPQPNPEPAESRKGAGAMVGALERLTGRALHGWAYNPDQPDAPALVDVYDDERYLGSITADRSRPRLYEKGFPSGARGFVFELPADTEEAAAARLRARIAGTSYDLRRARDFAAEAAPAEPPRQARDIPAAHETPSPPPTATARRAMVPEAEGVDQTVALWPVGSLENISPILEDWAAQRHPAVRVAIRRAGPPLPERLRHDPVDTSAKTAVAQLARETAFVLFAPAGARLDPELAATLTVLPGLPDVIAIDGSRPFWPGEAARAETFLAPARQRPIAVRSEILQGYPGNLLRELGDGLLSPITLWLAGRRDLIWTTLAAPGAAAEPEPEQDHRVRLWRGVLDEEDWAMEPAAIVPHRTAERISIALWRGWDEPALPGLRALVEDVTVPLDVLVPTEGDQARARIRLEGAERLLPQIGLTGARARIVDCPTGDLAVIRAMLSAADGEAVLLSDGSARLGPADLERLTRWSLQPHTGPVGLCVPEGWSSGAVLEPGLTLRPASAAEVADVISFGLTMVATARLGEVGLPPTDDDLGHAALLWTRTMAQHGFHAAVLAGGAERSGAPVLPPRGPLPWHVGARLRAGGLLDG